MTKLTGLIGEVRRVFNHTDLDSLILFVTNACNLRCGFCCYAEHLNQTPDISFENMLTISRTMPRFRALLISGGEPFIRPRLDEILLAFARNNGIASIYVPTNGWYLERTAEICRSFLDRNREVMLTLSFSVDGLADTHGRIRGKAETFQNLCATIAHLAPWRDTYPNLRLRVNSVVTPDNIGEIRATIDHFYRQYQLDEHGLEMVRDLTWRDAHHESPERKQMAGEFVALVQYANDLYYRTRGGAARRRQLGVLPEPLSNLATYAYNRAMADVRYERIMGRLWPFPCTAGRKILVIDGAGSLRACELRDEVTDLRQFDFDVGAALATGAMAKECAQYQEGPLRLHPRLLRRQRPPALADSGGHPPPAACGSWGVRTRSARPHARLSRHAWPPPRRGSSVSPPTRRISVPAPCSSFSANTASPHISRAPTAPRAACGSSA